MKKIFLLFFLFILGFFFRLWFISYSPQPVISDQMLYHVYAVEWIEKGITAAWFRTYGYPLFLVLIYKVAGIGNYAAVYTMQALIDTATGFLLFYLAKKIFKKELIAWLVLILYIFNPYTSGYVGVLLTEVMAGFLLVLFLLLVILWIPTDFTQPSPKRKERLVKYLLIGFVLGYLVQVRPAYMVWSIVSVVCIVAMLWFKAWHENKKEMKKWLGIGVLLIVGYILPFTYTVYTNIRFFNQFSLSSVIGLGQEFYTGTFIKDFPVFVDTADQYSPELPGVYGELFSNADTPQKREAVQQSMFTRAIERIAQDPVDYGVWRFRKMARMWDREKLFFYSEKDHAFHAWIFVWINRVIMVLAVVGVVKALRENRDNRVRLFIAYLIGTIGLFTILFSLTHAESRLTIPLLPIIFLFSAVGIHLLFNKKLIK